MLSIIVIFCVIDHRHMLSRVKLQPSTSLRLSSVIYPYVYFNFTNNVAQNSILGDHISHRWTLSKRQNKKIEKL